VTGYGCRLEYFGSSLALWFMDGAGIGKSIGEWLGTLREAFLAAREAY
jgi:hypothetical protein